jgi:hypothetical protein
MSLAFNLFFKIAALNSIIMKTIINLLLLFVGQIAFAQYNKENLTLEFSNSAEQYKFENLQLFPIRANQKFVNQHKNLGNYVTLKSALEKRKIEITEYSGGTVNTLYIENVSSDTIMILSGEVVQGGKQDRVIAQDFLLPPKSGKQDVSVFCVEHGRWQTKRGGDMSFSQYYSISTNSVRKAATVKKDQQDVWNEVAKVTKENKAETSTGTLTALQGSSTFSSDLKKYVDHFGSLFANQNDVIGVVVVAGDKILGCDMFATHELFQKQYASLLNSYATEAITLGKKAFVPYQKVSEYLQGFIADESRQESNVKEKGVIMRNGGKKIHISTFE